MHYACVLSTICHGPLLLTALLSPRRVSGAAATSTAEPIEDRRTTIVRSARSAILTDNVFEQEGHKNVGSGETVQERWGVVPGSR